MESTQSSPRYLQTRLARTSPSLAKRLDPGARTATTGSGSSITDTSFPGSSQINADKPFLNIDTDVFLLIINYLDIRDVIALCRTCRDLSQKCLAHSVWVSVVMTNVTSKKLPWPSYAWPLFEVSAATLERLCFRAVQMKTKWDAERLRQDFKLSRCIQRPWNSITWMAMLRSRWLIVQLDKRRLELWDIERPFTSSPVSYFDGLDAMVDGHKFSQTFDESWPMVLATRAHKTYHIRIVLPQMGVPATQAPQFDLLKTIAGCSGVLDVGGDLALFSRSTSDDGAIAQCQHSATTTILRSEREEPKLDHAVSAKVTTNVVVVVRRTAIEFYSLDAIHCALKSCLQSAVCGVRLAGGWFTFSKSEVFGLRGFRSQSVSNTFSILVEEQEREVFNWMIPDSHLDLARFHAFDEATGVCAVALGSGRIWIADPFYETELNNEDGPLKEIEFPWAGEAGHRSISQEVLLPPMATKIYRWFPGKNNPQAFGSAKWFVNEVLHIPGPATVLLIGTPHPGFRSDNSFEIIDIGGRLLCMERDDGMAAYFIKLLHEAIKLEDVVEFLKGGRFLVELPGKKVAVDDFSLNEYGSWRQRREKGPDGGICMW
ncbi:hypothetical protein FRC01_002029 [Tulasnella sp. 417]|nr:hypothetical protein FRC01_002029 [Tulasnella sp. 417]